MVKFFGLNGSQEPSIDEIHQQQGRRPSADEAIALGVKVKMATGDQLAIAKETCVLSFPLIRIRSSQHSGRRLGLGDHMYPAKVIKEGPTAANSDLSLDALIPALYIYPFESHAPRARENFLDLWARWLDWFDRYVKNGSQQTTTQ